MKNNAELALRKVGLLQGGPIHVEEYQRRMAQAGRLKRFLDRQDQLMELPTDDIPPFKLP